MASVIEAKSFSYLYRGYFAKRFHQSTLVYAPIDVGFVGRCALEVGNRARWR